MFFISNVSIPRPPDVVTILWERNPLRPASPRTIVEATTIGEAEPCQGFLRSGQPLRPADDCLLDNGFKLLDERKLGVFGVTTYVREPKSSESNNQNSPWGWLSD